MMDDTYQINIAKTEFREAYNRSDVDQLLSVFDDEGFRTYPRAGERAIATKRRTS